MNNNKENSTYSVEDGHGNDLAAGLPADTAHATAQRLANALGEPVWLYCPAAGDEDEPAPSERIRPTT